MDELSHRPVLLDEVVQALRLRADGIYVDGTFGRGGHALAILERLGPHGRLLAFDRDPQAVQAAEEKFFGDTRFSIVRGPFSMMGQTMAARGWRGKIDGILLDLGVSSPQFDDPQRGFSFRHDGPLDMRMDPDSTPSAAQWLNHAEEQEIAAVIREYGEERFARRIAKVICRERAVQPIETTLQLARIVAQAVPTREPGKDPATRTFQALRMHVNRELDELRAVLPCTVEALAPGGRLAVISFHSLEDRMVKHFLRDEAKGDRFPPNLPIRRAQLNPHLRLIGKAMHASAAEVERNPRARSAVLRVAERLGASGVAA
jgi:16S rRNA (cytosine1402-N4)-methyltransferase